MKRIFLIIIFLLLTIAPKISLAAALDANSNSPADSINQQIDQLKDKVASKVAQLKLVEKMGVIGTVTSATNTQIIINDVNDKARIIDVDEITQFSSDNNNSYDISDIKKGSKISVLGLYNKDSERLLARFINEVSIPLFLNGVISGKDTVNYTLNLSTSDGTNYTVDVEDVTRTFEYRDGDLTEAGFSKLGTMQNAVVVGFPDPKQKDRITASRIITFPDTPRDPGIKIVEQSPSPTPTKSASK